MAVSLPQTYKLPAVADPAELADPAESARAAGLRYVSDQGPGIRRKRVGKAFSFIATDGRLVRDRETVRRIKSLVIPPAWTDVWICPDPRGHLQATGRDARRRKQYRYHPRWREVRDAVKYDRMIDFAAALPRIRQRTDRDLERSGLPREKVLATVVRLLEETRIRVGTEAYRKENGAYGLTTLRNRHVDVIGSEVRFTFRGKSGKHHRVELQDRRVARIIKRFLEIPGQDSSSTWTRTKSQKGSNQLMSTTTCARSPTRTSPRRTSEPGPAPSSRRASFARPSQRWPRSRTRTPRRRSWCGRSARGRP